MSSRAPGGPCSSQPAREEMPLGHPPSASDLLANAPGETRNPRGGRPVLPHFLNVSHASGASHLLLVKQSLFLFTESDSERTFPRHALPRSHPAGRAQDCALPRSARIRPIDSLRNAGLRKGTVSTSSEHRFKENHRDTSQRECTAPPAEPTVGTRGI